MHGQCKKTVGGILIQQLSYWRLARTNALILTLSLSLSGVCAQVLKRGENIDHMQTVTGQLKEQSSSFRS